jgi:cell division protein ZapA
MEEKDMTNITVLIAGRPYPLKVKVGDEDAIRQIVKDVNEKINRFQLTYNKKDKQDCLSMSLLTYAVDLHKSKTGNNDTPSFDPVISNKINQLDELLDHLLK